MSRSDPLNRVCSAASAFPWLVRHCRSGVVATQCFPKFRDDPNIPSATDA